MTSKHIIVSITVALLLGIGIGRYTLPAKIVEHTVIKEQKSELQNIDKKDNSVIIVTQKKSTRWHGDYCYRDR